MSSTIDNLELIKHKVEEVCTDYDLSYQDVDEWFVLSTDTELNVWSVEGEVGVVLYPRYPLNGKLSPNTANAYNYFVGTYEEFKEYFGL